MRVDAYELDAGPMQGRRQPSRTDPEVENRALGGAAPVEPRPEVFGFPERRIEVGEARVGVARVVPDDSD
jgi:hypothetical protein